MGHYSKLLAFCALALAMMAMGQQIQRFDIDFSQGDVDPVTGQICVLQQVCLSNEEALAKRLPQEPCFPPGCNCNTNNDCGPEQPECNNCQCSIFPQGCSCNRDTDCGGDTPFCNDCNCSKFPQGCTCKDTFDCGATAFCENCQCIDFEPGCNCADERDCPASAPFCNNCQCKGFPEGCSCSSDNECGGMTPFCNDCNCSAFPQGCNCKDTFDCGTTGFCENCVCMRFEPGCNCADDRDCPANSPFCNSCQCSGFPQGCNCNADSDCGGDNPFCNNCQCSRFPEGCTCADTFDCGSTAYCEDCQCKPFEPGCNCFDSRDCPSDAPNCNSCRCSRLPEGCNCENDSECAGVDAGKCVNCNCKSCPVSVSSSRADVINPPLTFVIDTTKSVKPDKFSIFNLTQKVVERIVEIEANIPSYTLITFNDFGPDFRRNVDLRINTPNVFEFRQEIVALRFESFDGGRDSKERLMQGLLAAVQTAPEKSLIVVFTDNGSKDLNLRREIIRMKNEKNLTVYIVLTPIFEGFPNDPSLGAYDEVSEQVFFINEVGPDALLTSVQTFEQDNCV